MSTWMWMTPAPLVNGMSGGKPTDWVNYDAILVNLDNVSVIEPTRFKGPDGVKPGTRIIWQTSSPRAERTFTDYFGSVADAITGKVQVNA
jgi:hypothetical protein